MQLTREIFFNIRKLVPPGGHVMFYLLYKHQWNTYLTLRQVQFIMVIELSGVQFGLKSYAWFQNWTSAQREFNLKSQVWFQTKIAQHKVQLPLYYIHFEIAQIQDFKYFVTTILSQFQIKLIHFLGGKNKSFGNKSCKICHMTLHVFHLPAIWSVTWNKPWSLIGCFVFSVASS